MLRQPYIASVSPKEEFISSLHEQSKDTLRFSELRYRRLFETAQDGILILDAESGKIVDANPFLKEILGYSQAELLGKQLWEIGVFTDIKGSKAAFFELQNKGYIRYKDLPLQTKDGRSIEVEFVSNVYMVDTQKVIQCNIRDITNRRNMEKLANSKTEELEQLNEVQEKTKQAMLNVMEDLAAAKALIEVEKAKDESMLASIGEGLIAVNNECKIMVINDAAEKMLGWKAKELIGKELINLVLEDEAGHSISSEKRPINIALTNGRTTNGTFFYVRKDKTRIPLAITVTPIKLDREIIGAVDIFRDITREKEIDRAKSEFVSLASHQLRTPLGIAKWYIEAIREEGYFDNVPQVAKEYLDEVYKSNERLLSLVRDLLSISRIDQGKVRDTPKLMDIPGLIKDVVKAMSILAAKNNITLYLNLKNRKVPNIFIDPLRLQEVIENLVANAITYSNSDGKIEIIIEKRDRMIFIAIKDTGIGISKEDKKKLFTKFFRSEKATIKNAEGSGLGLYVVKSYVDGWGGSIAVESSEGKGSTFTLTLPITTKQDLKRND